MANVCENILEIAIIGQSDILRLFLHAKDHAKINLGDKFSTSCKPKLPTEATEAHFFAQESSSAYRI